MLPMDVLPDFTTISDDELKALIERYVREEEEVSYRRRLLHGKIDILRAELVDRVKRGEPTQAFAAYVEEEGDDEAGDVASDAPMLVIRIGGGRAGEQFPITGDRMSIGRAPSAEVFLDDITVSREHAVLDRRDDGLHLS